MIETLIVLPTYNEIENLEIILGRIRASGVEADVVIVDDSSPDGTGQLADRLAAADERLSVIHRPVKQGLGPAYISGFAKAATGEYRFVVEIDADGSHDPAELPTMIQLARNGADLVIGSRWVPGGAVRNWPLSRQLISRAGNIYSRVMLRSRIRDITAGFRVYRSEALQSLDFSTLTARGYGFQIEMAWSLERAGMKVVEHPITFVERTAGVSKMRGAIVVEALLKVTLWGLRGARR